MTDRTPWNQLDAATRQALTNRLTTQQFNVLALWLAGCSYDTISTMLTLSPRTVRTHLKRALVTYHAIRQENAA